MSSISAPQGAGAGGYKPIDAYQSLSQLNESRRVTVDTTASYDNRQRMAQTLSIAEERSLVDATKDIAASLFNAFRTELGEALSHIGIKGEKAAEIVRDMSKAFVEAVRDGAGFSFSMIAAAYKETITQTASSVSHALEFTASSLSIDYNQATGELAVDTSKLKIDAVKTIQSDNLPAETQALFDFTDGDGVPTIAALFDRVHQYLVNTGFIGDDAETEEALALPTVDDAAYDMLLINDEAAGDEADDAAADAADAGTDAAVPAAAPPMFDAIARGEAGLASVKVQAIEEFTNSRQETITRMTFDLTVRVFLAKDKTEPEVTTTRNETSEVLDVTA